MLICISMRSLDQIYHVVQEFWASSLTDNRRTDSPFASGAIYAIVMISPTYKQTKMSVQ